MLSTLRKNFVIHCILTICLMALALACAGFSSHAASSPTVSGKVDASAGAYLRSKPSTSSSKVTTLNDNTKLSIKKEIFTKSNSTASTNRWFYVSVNGKTGYIRADLVDSISASSVKRVTTEVLNYRSGAGTGMTRKGQLDKGVTVYVYRIAQASSGETWYRIKRNGSFYYICAEYTKAVSSDSSKPVDTTGKSEVAQALLAKATDGGSARNVYTFSTSNCSKRFGVTGYKSINTTQGMAYTGSKYYILYGTDSGQRIVTYSSSGKRLAACCFNKNIGHPNGITWDPLTGVCYIFKGNQKTIYTWNPSTGKFGTATTPYSSSGVGYDKENELLYCSSKTGIRVYSADGKFTHKKLFSRCSHSDVRYIQDCGSGRGFVFHGVSGSDKAKTNYIDVYRISDGKYLGSIKVSIGEIESLIVNDDGYLEMLVNTSGTTDYVWKTPLNVKELED